MADSVQAAVLEDPKARRARAPGLEASAPARRWLDHLAVKKLLLAAGDVLAVVVAFYVAVLLRNYFFGWRGGVYTPTLIHVWFLGALCLAIVLYFRHGFLYVQSAFAPTINHLEKLTRAWITFVAFFIVVSFFLRVQLFIEHRITMMFFIVVGWLLLYLGRFMIVPWLFRRWGDNDGQGSRVLVVGSRHDVRELTAHLEETRLGGARLVGFVTEQEAAAETGADAPLCLGSVSALPEILQRQHADELFINLAHRDWHAISDVLQIGRVSRVLIRIALPHFGALHKKVPALPEVHGDFVYLNHSLFSGVERFCKRLFDLGASLVGLTLLAPLFGLLALLIKLDSPGPVFFRQKRVGQGRRVFEILKFRSMRQNTEVHHQEAVRRLVNKDAAFFEQTTGQQVFYKVTDAAQVTRVGRWLRRTSLDELPQLINVLRGEMSLVGPRPLPCYEVELFQPWQHLRHEVPPGMTGFWQVYGRSVVAHEDMVLMDAYYVMNWSLAMDSAILFRTGLVLLAGKGAV